MNAKELSERFAARFNRRCAVVARAPGRVNLIGEHTDYNDGFVLPIATEQETWVAGAPRADGRLRVFSSEVNDEQTWPVADWRRADFPHWTSYVAGVACLLQARSARQQGFDLLIRSDVPPGGGLSSSAALEIATALALTRLMNVALEAHEMIDLCRRAEHEFARVPCGLMDQSVSLCARAGTAYLLDCRSRQAEYVPCELGDHVFVLVDSGVRHELAASEYARRQAECRQAVECFHRLDESVRALRDVSMEALQARAHLLEPLPAARARHVVSENARTLAAAEALRAGDLPRLGRLMTESHSSLRDDYQVSCPELDRLVEIVSGVEGVLGARMTGGGFGGCIVALARAASVTAIADAVRRRYDCCAPTAARVLRTRPGSGASVELS